MHGGAAVTPEFLALPLALSVYTSAFLSLVIRSGLDAVPHSLLEAAWDDGWSPTGSPRRNERPRLAARSVVIDNEWAPSLPDWPRLYGP